MISGIVFQLNSYKIQRKARGLEVYADAPISGIRPLFLLSLKSNVLMPRFYPGSKITKESVEFFAKSALIEFTVIDIWLFDLAWAVFNSFMHRNR